MTSHILLCPKCGYSFWTTNEAYIDPDRMGHCSVPYDPYASDFARMTYRWLIDADAIDYIAGLHPMSPGR